MCGIWGLLSMKKSDDMDESKFHSSFMTIKYRGPDNSVYISKDHYKIGFHRLAINDTSIYGDQPFSHTYKCLYKNVSPEEKNLVIEHECVEAEDRDSMDINIVRTIYIIINGEIYNYKEIVESDYFKTSMKKTGYVPRSTSDCEILLPIYMYYGIDFLVKQLNGEFAFAIYDVKEDCRTGKKTYNLFLGRDRFGIRPLFYSIINKKTIAFSSEMCGLSNFVPANSVDMVRPRTWLHVEGTENNDFVFRAGEYYKIGNTMTVMRPDLDDVKKVIRECLVKSVEIRLNSDREIGCLLSGGLDSSLVAGIASKYLKSVGKKLRTFSIGMCDSTDNYYANIVSKHIDSVHTSIIIEKDVWLKTLPKIVEICGTWDITTIRATTGQFLVSKWIKENTDIKVLLVGDGSDELASGYLYFHAAPSIKDAHFENIRLLEEIHMYDVLRADRGIASNGLEARVPFLDHNFVNLYLAIDPECRVVKEKELDGKKFMCEKWLLRSAFEDKDKSQQLLPDKVLWRKKEAFSDGVSPNELDKSWYQIIQSHVGPLISDEMCQNMLKKTYLDETVKKLKDGPIEKLKEAVYYRQLFENIYSSAEKCTNLCPHYWLPKWLSNNDPSARTLKIYSEI